MPTSHSTLQHMPAIRFPRLIPVVDDFAVVFCVVSFIIGLLLVIFILCVPTAPSPCCWICIAEAHNTTLYLSPNSTLIFIFPSTLIVDYHANEVKVIIEPLVVISIM